MRILFVLSHELYLRNFAGVIAELAEHGHEVALAFTAPRGLADTGLAELLAAHENVWRIEGAVRQDRWTPVTNAVRGTLDYLHSLDPAFDHAPKIRQRVVDRVPRAVRLPIAAIGSNRWTRRATQAMLHWMEWCIPPMDGVAEWLDGIRPDVMAISPVLDFNYQQVELLKAARQRGLATVHLVASWDNLTMKGLVQMPPDGMVVWNHRQVEEARRIHGFDPGRIRVTGAQLYDQWFDMAPATDRAEFCARAGGLDSQACLLLYAGSSPYIAPDEVEFFNSWLNRLRADPNPRLAQASVLVRPHPLHSAQWSAVATDPLGPGHLAVWPRDGEMPMKPDQQQRYFDSLWHADALVGINTSAFLEAGILGRRTFGFHGHRYAGTQVGTLHFAYVAESGLVRLAPDLDNHMADLAREVGHTSRAARERLPFIADFLRPNGIDRAAAPQVVEAIEAIAAQPVVAPPRPFLAPVARLLLGPVASLLHSPRFSRRPRPDNGAR